MVLSVICIPINLKQGRTNNGLLILKSCDLFQLTCFLSNCPTLCCDPEPGMQTCFDRDLVY